MLDNCLCIAAVDFQKLEQAWRQKYSLNLNDDDDSLSFLEKNFQIRIGVPLPNKNEIQDYVDELLKDVKDDKVRKILADIGPSNPRTIKRMLNKISYRLFLVEGDEEGKYVAVYWTLLEEILTRKMAIRFYENLSKTTNLFKNSYRRTYGEIQKYLDKDLRQYILDTDGVEPKLQQFVLRLNKLVRLHHSSDMDKSFEIMYKTAKELE